MIYIYNNIAIVIHLQVCFLYVYVLLHLKPKAILIMECQCMHNAFAGQKAKFVVSRWT